MKKHRESTTLSAILFLLPSGLGLLAFSLIPIVASLFISLTSWDGMTEITVGSVGALFVGVNNYVEALSGGEFWRVLGNTLYFIVMYIPLIIASSLAIAMILSSKRRTVGVFRIAYYIPVLTSWVAGALIWKWMLSPEYGLINDALRLVGIAGPSWLLDAKWAMPGIVMTSVWKDVGYFGLIMLGGLQNINPGLYEAADIDGANSAKKFFRITLPLLTPILFMVLVITLINSFQLFPQIMIMTARDGMAPGEPQGATQVMVERIYTYAFRYYKMGYAAAWSWILFAIVFIITLVQLKLQKRWVNYEG